MENKSLKINALLSGGQKLLSLIFPLITFPYISRVLLVDNIGKINFTSSIISYFVLLAGLGINNYATREGAMIRNEKESINQFSSEIFSINIISTLISYILLLIMFLYSNKLEGYGLLLLIQSFNIIGNTIGVNWIYSLYEDYLYIAIRTFAFQLISLITMILCVRKPEDFYIYAAISVFSAIGANILNLFHSKKYIKLTFTWKLNLKKHLKPILIIFSSAIAISIYINSDMTILGWMCGDYSVGLYSTSVKIYTIIKQLVASMVIVSLPRMSNMIYNRNINEYNKITNNLFGTLLVFCLPISIGIFMIAENIIWIIGGDSYLGASTSLRILGISLFFAILSSFITYSILLPYKMEKIQLRATIISAIINIILNFLLIPMWAENAAAFTTLLAEFTVFSVSISFLLKDKNKKVLFYVNSKDIVALIIGSIFIIITTFSIKILNLNLIMETILIIIISSVSYFVILKVLGHSLIDSVLKKIKYKMLFKVKSKQII